MMPDLELRHYVEEHRRRIEQAKVAAIARGQQRAVRLRRSRLRAERRAGARRQLRTRLADRLRHWADRLEPAGSFGVGAIRAAEPGPAPASGRRPSRPRR